MLEFFFFTFFWSPEAVVLAAAARQSHEGSGLVAEVLGGGFGRRTTPHSMGAAPWGSSCAVEKEMIPIGIELVSFFSFHFFVLSFFQFGGAHAAEHVYCPSSSPSPVLSLIYSAGLLHLHLPFSLSSTVLDC